MDQDGHGVALQLGRCHAVVCVFASTQQDPVFGIQQDKTERRLFAAAGAALGPFIGRAGWPALRAGPPGAIARALLLHELAKRHHRAGGLPTTAVARQVVGHGTLEMQAGLLAAQ